MGSENELDKFGRFVTEHYRDKAVDYADGLLNNRWTAPALHNIQEGLKSLSVSQKQTVRKAVLTILDSAIHDLLFALQEQADFDNSIQIIVNGKNIVELSDGIHGEPLTDEGWFARFSKHEIIE